MQVRAVEDEEREWLRATLKPSIPATGHDGIPIRDELDLVLDVQRATEDFDRHRG